ncbi:hormogonium polysaccharide biosynthesis glycosyltransferase HpsE [Leptolyngbya sp. FACHB-261]|uniref:hormogonium polysaccharide biosynthesis glycosyltransferase HpsE n=1 Tax=Leptolyngbya sp. FACHB-261 TaxID=2692806 RepID=UPI0016871665|nr:hormogonium polysaccharide biosynthesis glycosyltransferase HpsE [Leptolyngbya sp. FACHB-261]MBD2103616.1 glycosyltransferase family 2 protein [Leptolyngbya sp. FACHB-261]
MSLDFTVAIPTYNGASRLPAILDRLKTQVQVDQIAWEIIIVDNNSKDDTAKVVQEYQANWPEAFPLKYYFEAEQGAAFARVRAVQEAQAELIGFIDDDNLPAPDWVSAAYSFGQEHPKAGAYGGQIHGDYEVAPPENFRRIQSFLAIRERGSKPHLYDPENLSLPPAAAVVVRKSVWYNHVPSRPKLSGKVRGSMVQGDDYEPLLYMYRAGWEIWYNPAMHTHHQIPHWRLERDYLMSLVRGSSLCICDLRMINAKSWQKPIVFTKILLGSTRRTLLHVLKYRGKIKTDLIAACEMEFFLGSLLSPFYFLNKTLKSKTTALRDP